MLWQFVWLFISSSSTKHTREDYIPKQMTTAPGSPSTADEMRKEAGSDPFFIEESHTL